MGQNARIQADALETEWEAERGYPVTNIISGL